MQGIFDAFFEFGIGSGASPVFSLSHRLAAMPAPSRGSPLVAPTAWQQSTMQPARITPKEPRTPIAKRVKG